MKNTLKTLFFALAAMVFTVGYTQAQSVQEGLKNLNAERYTKAGEIFKSLVASAPTADNYFQLGRYYLSTPEYKSNIALAEDAFTKGNATEKKGDPINQVGLGMVKLANKDFAGAKMIFDEAIKSTKGKDANVYYRVAEAYTMFPDAQDAAEAIMNIDKALEVRKEDNPQFYVVKGQAYLIKNEGGDAMNALENAARVGSPDMASIYSQMAEVWLRGKNYKEAKEAIDKSIAADQTHAPAYYYLSSFHQTYQRWDEAAKAAEQYLLNSDGDCGAKLRYIKLAFTAKDFDNVLSKLKEIETCNDDPIVHRLSGISKFELGRPREAVADIKYYIQQAKPEDVYGLDYGFIGRSYLAMDDADQEEANDQKAIEAIEKAVAMNDTTFDYYTELGTYFQDKKDYEKAAQFLEKAIANKKNPNGEDWFRLGILQYQIKDWVKADSSFDKVCEAYKETWAPPYVLSGRIKTLRNPEDSLFSYSDRFETYIKILKANNEISAAANQRNVWESYNYLIGKEFTVNKDMDKALALVEEYLSYFPTDEAALQLKGSITGVPYVKPEAPATPE